MAMTLLVVGVILTIARPGVAVPQPPPCQRHPRAAGRLGTRRLLELGLLVLLATPFARVVALGIAFARRRRWLFAGISLVVTTLLILGAVLGLSLG